MKLSQKKVKWKKEKFTVKALKITVMKYLGIKLKQLKALGSLVVVIIICVFRRFKWRCCFRRRGLIV